MELESQNYRKSNNRELKTKIPRDVIILNSLKGAIQKYLNSNCRNIFEYYHQKIILLKFEVLNENMD